MTSNEKLSADIAFDCGYDQGHEDGQNNERKAIVDWLRNQKTYWPSDIADAIEAGEHQP